MKHFLLVCIAGLVLSPIYGQMYYQDGRQVCCGDSLLTGSYQTLSINPANLGRAGRLQKSIGILQIGGNFYSHGLDKGQLLDFAFSDKLLSEPQKEAIIANETPSENFFYDGNIEINWVSFSLASPKMGGIAINVKDQVFSTLTLPNSVIGLLIQGTNSDTYQAATNPDALSRIADGTFGNFHHLRTASVGYGRRVVGTGKWNLYLGGTYKHIWAIGYYQAQIEQGVFSGRSAFSDFYSINYGLLNLNTASGRRELLSDVGTGQAIDIGGSLDVNDKINIGVSIIDIGSIKWKDQVVEYQGDFSRVIDSLGSGLVNSYDFSEEATGLYDLMESGTGESFTSQLHTRLRAQGTFRIKQSLNASFDVSLPLREESPDVLNYQPTLIAGNLNWEVMPKLLTLNSGVLYSEKWGMRMPFGIMFGIKDAAMLSVSTADLLTFLSGRDPYASLSVATVNFGF